MSIWRTDVVVEPTARAASVVAVLTTRPDADGRELRELPAAVSHLEIRADLVGDLDPAWLRRHFAGKLIYTLRSAGHGGRFADSPQVRRTRLATAAAGYDLVDLEASTDLVPDVLSRVRPTQRRICWRGGPLSHTMLRAQLDWLVTVPAQLYLLAPAVDTCEQALSAMRLLAGLRRRDVTAFGTGPQGVWSRLLAPWLGAPVVYGRVTAEPDGSHAGGAGPRTAVPTVRQLVTDYPFPALPPIRRLYGIVGRTVENSLSPRLHNLGYRRRGLPSLFLPFSVPDQASFVTGFWPRMPAGLDELGMPLRGLTVTAPHKEAALSLADSASPTARAAGSANALLRRNGRWRAETTDASAAAALLRRANVTLQSRSAAVLGCGGAGRASAVALIARGAQVTLVNRGIRRGRLAARLLGVPFAPLASFAPAGSVLLVHATPIRADLPVDVDALADDAVVLDLVYGQDETALVAAARRRGLLVIDGWQVLAAEVADQFRLMTGRTLPDLQADDLDRPDLQAPIRRLGAESIACAGQIPKE
jgi:3-dehydroquinate dehydratase/shikimate dehydrogenase